MDGDSTTANQVVYWSKSRKVRVDPGREPTAGFFSGLIVVGTVNRYLVH